MPESDSQAKLDPLLLAIVGPTASGKSALAMALAERLNGEIVSCDSVAVYRGFEIGTAKPSREDRARFPHHLIDVAFPDEPFTAGEYARQARAAVSEIAGRGKTPIVAGGTGLYLRALVDGLFPGPQRSEELRQRLRERAIEKGSEQVHRILLRLDPAAAAAIHANDLSKMIRAIEVCMASRQKMTQLWEERGRDPLTGFRVVRIGLNPERSALYERINVRCQWMFENGLIEETRALMQQYPRLLEVPNSPFSALGYRQAVQHIRGEITHQQAIAVAQQGHRNYAKRQLTWFRREPGLHWLDSFGDDPAALVRAQQIVSLAR